jgi:hypothetical protein
MSPPPVFWHGGSSFGALGTRRAETPRTGKDAAIASPYRFMNLRVSIGVLMTGQMTD